MGEINAHLNETIQGLQVIQAYGREDTNSTKFEKANRKYFGSYMNAIRLDQAFWPLADIVGAAGTCIVIWYGASEYIAGNMTLGLMLAFTNYLASSGRRSALSRAFEPDLSAIIEKSSVSSTWARPRRVNLLPVAP